MNKKKVVVAAIIAYLVAENGYQIKRNRILKSEVTYHKARADFMTTGFRRALKYIPISQLGEAQKEIDTDISFELIAMLNEDIGE